MKRRIRLIFILMTLCILGINVFQGYWLYSTYQLHNQQFSRTATEALLVALQKQQETEARQLFEPGAGRGPLPNLPLRRYQLPGPVRERIVVIEENHPEPPFDSARPGQPADVIAYERIEGADRIIRNIDADTLASRISKRLILNWFSNTPFNTRQLDSLYREELAFREVAAEFRLDTIRATSTKQGHPRLATVASGEYPVQLRPIPVNPVRHLLLQASFKTPVPYILRKMSGLLVCSLLLLGLTTGCFLYMLSTILRQKKLSEIKHDFINNMTHELKTPLATVSAAVEAMLSFGALQNAQKAQRYLTVSRNELQRLADLVEQVLNMAVAEKKEMDLHPELLRPTELISQVVANHQLKAPKPVAFVVDDNQEDGVVHADRMHLSNTLNNLIDNAIKYSREQVTIHIRSQWQSDGWQLSVGDNGIGIPRSYQQAIFDRFFRVPTGDLHQVKGFGLGLSYVKQVVEKHGGRIGVRSEPGRGSEFILWFPLRATNH
jgi:signal transduction histidine kinase